MGAVTRAAPKLSPNTQQEDRMRTRLGHKVGEMLRIDRKPHIVWSTEVIIPEWLAREMRHFQEEIARVEAVIPENYRDEKRKEYRLRDLNEALQKRKDKIDRFNIYSLVLLGVKVPS